MSPPERPRVGITAPGMTREHPTGVGNHLTELLAHLRPGSRDPEVHVLGTLPGTLTLDSALRVHPVRSDSITRRLLEDHLGFGIRARCLNLQLLHAPKSVLPLGFSGRRTMTVHDVIFRTHPHFYTRRERWYWSLVLRCSVRRADALVAVSDQTAARLTEHLDVDPGKVEVIPNGVDPDRFHPGPGRSPNDPLPDRPNDDPYYLYLGTFTPRKNVDRLVKAYARARASFGDLPDLVLAGPPGSGSETRVDQVRNLGLESSVHFPGYVEDRDLPDLYRGADRLIYPSLAEGFGLPVLQALVCGCPVACSDIDVLREVAGDLALYFDPEQVSSMVQALDPNGGPGKPGSDGRDRLLKKYRSTNVADRYLNFFRRVLDR